MNSFDATIGFSRLGAIHLNDCKGSLGGHLDRHAHIGRGGIGLDSFRALINWPDFCPDLPGLLETPVDSPGDDKENVDIVKNLRRPNARHLM